MDLSGKRIILKRKRAGVYLFSKAQSESARFKPIFFCVDGHMRNPRIRVDPGTSEVYQNDREIMEPDLEDEETVLTLTLISLMNPR